MEALQSPGIPDCPGSRARQLFEGELRPDEQRQPEPRPIRRMVVPSWCASPSAMASLQPERFERRPGEVEKFVPLESEVGRPPMAVGVSPLAGDAWIMTTGDYLGWDQTLFRDRASLRSITSRTSSTPAAGSCGNLPSTPARRPPGAILRCSLAGGWQGCGMN